MADLKRSTTVMYGNWHEDPDRRGWRHSSNQRVCVFIIDVSKSDPDRRRGKYRILHVHPAPAGSIRYQYPEYAETIKAAREKAYVHLKHWNSSLHWSLDPDYGKGMDYATFQNKGLGIPKSYCRR